MTTDDLRTRAREAAEEAYRKPRWHVGTVTDRLIEAFCEGFLAHAAQQPTVDELAAALWASVDGKGIDGRLYRRDCDYLARVAKEHLTKGDENDE